MKPSVSHKLLVRIQTIVSCFALISIMFFVVPAHAQTGLHFLPTRHVCQVVTNGKAQLIGSIPSTQLMHVDIVLPLRNQAALTNLLGQFYDPSSSNYRQFLSAAQSTTQFGPTVVTIPLTGIVNLDTVYVLYEKRVKKPLAIIPSEQVIRLRVCRRSR